MNDSKKNIINDLKAKLDNMLFDAQYHHKRFKESEILALSYKELIATLENDNVDPTT